MNLLNSFKGHFATSPQIVLQVFNGFKNDESLQSKILDMNLSYLHPFVHAPNASPWIAPAPRGCNMHYCDYSIYH